MLSLKRIEDTTEVWIRHKVTEISLWDHLLVSNCVSDVLMGKLRSRGQQLLDRMLFKEKLRPLPHSGLNERKTNSVSYKEVEEYSSDSDSNDNYSNNSSELSDQTYVCSVNDGGQEFRNNFSHKRHLRPSYCNKTLGCDQSKCDYTTADKELLKRNFHNEHQS